MAQKNVIHASQYLHQLERQSPTVRLSPGTIGQCKTYALGKLARQPFHRSEARAKRKLKLVHYDVCYVGPQSIDKYKYFLIFLDDYIRKNFIYYLEVKSDV